MTGVCEPVWLGQLEGRGTEECSEGRGSGGQTLLIAQLCLGWTRMAALRMEAFALPRHRMRTLSGLQSESSSPGCF